MQSDEFFDNPELHGLTSTASEFAIATSDGADRSTRKQVSLLPNVFGNSCRRKSISWRTSWMSAACFGTLMLAQTSTCRFMLATPIRRKKLTASAFLRAATSCHGDTSHFPEASTLEVTQRLRLGTYLSAPVRLRDGRVSALCCINHAAMPALGELEVQAWRSVAAMVSARLEAGGCVATQA